jgi:hypothetical protein
MGSIIFFAVSLILTFFVLIAVLCGYLNAKNLSNYIYIPKIILVLICICIFFITWRDIKEYNSYNNLKFDDVKKIVLNNIELNTKMKYLFFEELKKDFFYLPEHPDFIKSDSVIVFTTVRKYVFYIEVSSNQGVIVSRIDEKGNNLGMNRNDSFLKMIKDVKNPRSAKSK